MGRFWATVAVTTFPNGSPFHRGGPFSFPASTDHRAGRAVKRTKGYPPFYRSFRGLINIACDSSEGPAARWRPANAAWVPPFYSALFQHV